MEKKGSREEGSRHRTGRWGQGVRKRRREEMMEWGTPSNEAAASS